MTVQEIHPVRTHGVDTEYLHDPGKHSHARPPISMACWRTIFLTGFSTALFAYAGLPVAAASPESSTPEASSTESSHAVRHDQKSALRATSGRPAHRPRPKATTSRPASATPVSATADTTASGAAAVSAPKSVDTQPEVTTNVVTTLSDAPRSPLRRPAIPADSNFLMALVDAVRRELWHPRRATTTTPQSTASLTTTTSPTTDVTTAVSTKGPVATTAVLTNPVAVNDSFSGTANTPITGNVQTNDIAPSSKPLTTKLVTGPVSGTLVLNTNGTFTYTPAANFSGTDTFTYMDNVASRKSGVATVTLTVVPAPQPPAPTTLPIVGVQGINQWDGLTQSQVTSALAAAKAAGATQVRMTISWAIVERNKGTYDWSTIDPVLNNILNAGMTPMAVVYDTPLWLSNTTNPHTPPANATQDAQFGQFAAAVAQRYAGKITTFEIWNEQNITQFWPNPDPARYTAVLKAAYTAIKNVAPNDRVIVGGLAPDPTGIPGTIAYINGMYAAGAKGYFDEMTYHDYFQPWPVVIDPLAAIHDVMVANGDGGKQIWITEAGAPTGTSSISETQQQQADTITTLLKQAQQYSYIGPIYFYEIMDNGTNLANPENNFGLITQAGVPKLAYTALKNFMTAASATTAA